jgi:hypothetical protein
MADDFDIAKILSNPLHALFLSMNPQAMQMLEAITRQRQQREERDYQRQQREREHEDNLNRQTVLDARERLYKDAQIANMQADNARREAAAQSAFQYQQDLEQQRREQNLFNRRMDVLNKGGVRTNSLSNFWFSKNLGQGIQVDDHEVYRMPTPEQVEQRKQLLKQDGKAPKRNSVGAPDNRIHNAEPDEQPSFYNGYRRTADTPTTGTISRQQYVDYARQFGRADLNRFLKKYDVGVDWMQQPDNVFA